jgi:hypothetical protein
MTRSSVTWTTDAAEANDNVIIINKPTLSKESTSTRDADADEQAFFDAEEGRYVPVYPYICGRFGELTIDVLCHATKRFSEISAMVIALLFPILHNACKQTRDKRKDTKKETGPLQRGTIIIFDKTSTTHSRSQALYRS